MFSKQPAKKPSLERYVDPTGELTNKKLKFGEWYVRNRLLLRKITVASLTAWCIGFGGYSLFGWGKWVAIDIWNDNKMLVELTQQQIPWAYWRDARAPQPLVIAPVEIAPSSENKVDFIALAENPNKHWTAAVTYHFVYGGAETDPRTISVYPGQKRALLSLGNINNGGAQLIIDNTEWARFNPHQISDPAAYVAERFKFGVRDFLFEPASAATGAPTHSVTFTIVNDSAYSFWAAKFTVLYLDGNQVVGVKQIEVPQFRSGESRVQEIKSLAPQLNVTNVEIFPDVNPFGPSTFMAPGQ